MLTPTTARRPALWTFALEVVLIVLSVLLALGLNAWREARSDAARAERVLEALRAEIAYNRAQIAQIAAYHARVDEAIDTLVPSLWVGAEPGPETLFEVAPEGLSVRLLETTAWELARSTGTLTHLDFELAADLSRLYRQQAFLQEKMDRLGDNLYEAGNLTSMRGILLATGALVNDIVIQERRLPGRYDAVLAQIDSTLAQ